MEYMNVFKYFIANITKKIFINDNYLSLNIYHVIKLNNYSENIFINFWNIIDFFPILSKISSRIFKSDFSLWIIISLNISFHRHFDIFFARDWSNIFN